MFSLNEISFCMCSGIFAMAFVAYSKDKATWGNDSQKKPNNRTNKREKYETETKTEKLN